MQNMTHDQKPVKMERRRSRMFDRVLNKYALWALIFVLAIGYVAISRAADVHTSEMTMKKDDSGEVITAEFSLQLNGYTTPYDVTSVFLMPGEKLNIDIVFPRAKQRYTFLESASGKKAIFDEQIEWLAPATPGFYQLEVFSKSHKVLVNAFVKIPAAEVDKGKIGFYRIGEYPSDKEIKNKTLYVVPDGYIEVTDQNRSTKLSPSFTLGEFVSKQKSKYPKYVFLYERLLLKLELIKHELNRKGVDAKKIIVMSGYRTPYYNKSIGNVKFSRHVFGDAADIFIDNDGDYYMDDINGDGKRNYADAKKMADIIENLSTRESYKPFVGGLGIYGSKPHRGPFVHVDTRGYSARWSKP